MGCLDRPERHAWLTGICQETNDWQPSYLNKTSAKDFSPSGTTQNQFRAAAVKRFWSRCRTEYLGAV